MGPLGHRQAPGWMTGSRRGVADAGGGGPIETSSPAIERNCARASGRIVYQIHVPRRWPSIQPASRRTLRWWLTVGWATSPQLKSQAQTAPSLDSWRRMARRVGIGGRLEEPDLGIGLALHGAHCIGESRY